MVPLLFLSLESRCDRLRKRVRQAKRDVEDAYDDDEDEADIAELKQAVDAAKAELRKVP